MTKLLKDKKSREVFSGFFKITAFVIGIFFLSFLTSCRNSPSILGVKILPDDSDLQVHGLVWNGPYGYSILEDSVRSDNLPVNLLGSMFDSTFGVTTAGVAAQFVLSSNGVTFGKNPQLDSLVLEIRYSGSLFGDSTTSQTLHVYELNQDIYFDSSYYSNTNFQTYDIDYANMQFVPTPHDSTIVGEDTLAPTLRINLSLLNPDLALKILNADTTDLEDNESFTSFFKGLYLVTDPVITGGSIFGISLVSHGSRLALYYSNDDNDSLVYNFFVGEMVSPRINTYTHDFALAAADFKQQVLQGDTALGGQKFYVQGIGGVKAIVKIPNLHEHDSLNYDHIAINEAKLFLPGLTSSKYPPARLALVRILDDGSYEPLIDEYEGETYFDGKYNKGANQYMFRITRYVQKLVSDEGYANNGLYLFVSGASYKPNYFTFRGNLNQGDTTSNMRLEIIYTIVN